MKNNIEISEKAEYQWYQEWANPIAHTDIKKVIAELEAIQETRGKITPEFLVESAKNKKSVLHDYFEWDDTKAANSWRIRQASRLISNIEVKVIKDGEPKIMKAFEITSQKFGKDYTYTKRLDLTEKNNGVVKNFCVGLLHRAQNRLSSYPEFSQAVQHIDAAIKELTKESTETKEEAKPPLTAVV